MERRRIATTRAVAWVASIALATFGGLGIGTGPASADAALSSIVLSQALPGMVTVPSGPLNGPLTQSEVESWGADSGPTSALGQAIGSGQVNGYRRMWVNQPPNGAFVQILAVQMPSAGDASVALGGADDELGANPLGHFAVPEIAGARGYTVTSNTSSGVATQEDVSFAKGPIVFQVSVGLVTSAANPGTSPLSQDDAIQIAQQQAAVAPGSLSGPSYASSSSQSIAFTLGEFFGAALLVGGLVVLVIFLVRRSKGGNASAVPPAYWMSPGGPAATGFPPPQPPPAGSPGLGAAPAPGRAGTALLERPTASRQPGFYCSWCGSHVEVGATVRHDCGPRDRPTAYCMGCGAKFESGATSCASCGSPRLQ
jgi:hypothetical protein